MIGTTGKRGWLIRSALSVCLVAVVVVLASCGGGGGGSTSSSAPPPRPASCASGETAFWAADFTTNAMYSLCAREIAVGNHSRIFVENIFSTITATDVAWINTGFDAIYASDTANFGSEPNEDGDAKITILLLNVRDGYNGTTVTSYTAGYFDPGNEYPLSANAYSNQREMFYMNINPSLPLTQEDFNKTIAHEFQHMIHWEQKVNLQGLDDDIWLNEAMSEVAPTFLYGPNYTRVFDYEQDPSNSLTQWDGAVNDYGIVYMWSQYYKDRFGGSIFKSIMQRNSIGITSVNEVLATLATSPTFTSTFYDLSIAILSGKTSWGPGYEMWSYTSIDTAPGTYNGVTLPGLFTAPPNPSTLPALGPWSIGFSSYTPGLNGFTWTAQSSSQKATFYDTGGGWLYTDSDLSIGTPISYSTLGYLVVANQSGAIGSGGSVVNSAPKIMGSALYQSPKQMLAAANRKAQADGRPRGICVHSAFTEKEKELRQKGFKPGF